MRKYNFILRIILTFLTKPLFGMDVYFDELDITTPIRSSLSNMSLDHKTQIYAVLPQMIGEEMDIFQKSEIIKICKLVLESSLLFDNFADLFQSMIQTIKEMDQEIDQRLVKYSQIIDEAHTAAKAYWESIFEAG